MLNAILRSCSRQLIGVPRYLHCSVNLLGKVVQFNLSDIGEGIAEVHVKEWFVKAGDRVAQFDNVCEVQSDKASVTISSRYDGVIKKLYYNVDDVAKVGNPLVDVELEGDADESSDSSSSESSSSSSDDVEKAEVVESKQDLSSPQQIIDTASTVPAYQGDRSQVLTTPAVRRIAKENSVMINLFNVPATGRDGRILKEDIVRFLTHGEPQVVSRESIRSEVTSDVPSKKLPTPKLPLTEDVLLPLKGYRRAMVKTMTLANNIPHFGYNDEFDVDGVMVLRSQLQSIADAHGVKMTYLPIFIKACSLALTQFPGINAHVDDTCDNVIHRASHNISVAMDTKEGLVVPNIKHCEQLSVIEIARELNRLQVAGNEMKFSPTDLTGGTFTISNIGIIGGTYASPVILPPQVAIVAVGKIMKKPRFNEKNEVVAANLVTMSFAADHRVIDGVSMARFSNLWKYLVENPSAMLAELK